MKIIREHIIFEKFKQQSDPIEDMGIGLPFYRIKPGTILKLIRDVTIEPNPIRSSAVILFEDPKIGLFQSKYIWDTYVIVKRILNKTDDSLKLQLIHTNFMSNIDIIRQIVLNGNAHNFHITYGETDYETWQKYFEVYKL